MKIHLTEVNSTNSWLLEQLAQGQELADGTVVWTDAQTAGRGQRGNVWESEPGKNLTFSLLLRPDGLAPRDQFVISEVASLAVLYGLQTVLPAEVAQRLSVKWPNDVYVGDEKICGMLVENQLQGSKIAYSVVGIGVNVNQTKWVGNAPNPTSVKRFTAEETALLPLLDAISDRIYLAMEALSANPEVMFAQLHADYVKHLYRREGFHSYVDAQSGEPFEGRLVDVESNGLLHLQVKDGEERTYGFKEVKFVLPCGVTKE